MALVRLWVGTQVRRHWRAQAALALLIGIVGAVVLATGAGARATATAYDRYLARQAIPDVELDGVANDAARQEIARLPGVRSSAAYLTFFAAPGGPGAVPGQDFLVIAGADRFYGHVVDRPIVVRGRLPRPGAADEIAINEDAASRYRLGVGARLRLVSLAADETEALFAGRFDQLTFHGPKPAVRVVGVVRTRLDLGHAGYAKSYALAGPAFARANAQQMSVFPPQLAVRLENPANVRKFTAAAHDVIQRISPDEAGDLGVNGVLGGLTSIRDATHVQALALGLVALAAACAGLVALVQVVARSVAAVSEDFPALRAMGVAGTDRARLIAVSFLPTAVLGGVIAFAAATVASSRFPTGVARRAAPPPGVHVDALVLVPGALVLVLVVASAAAVSAYRWRPLPLVGRGSSYVGPLDRAVSALPPAPRVGVRWALPRRDLVVTGRGRSAIAGALVGFCAVAAAVTYWAGLHHLVSTPSAYGWTFDVDGGGGTDVSHVLQERDALLRSPVVGDVAVAKIVGSVPIENTQGDAYGFEAVRGHTGPAVLQGRAPAAADEVMLGTKTARRLHKSVGSHVRVTPGPGAQPVTLRVVGVGLLPTIEGDAYALGIAFTRPGLEKLAGDNGYLEAVFTLKPGVDRARALARLRKSDFVSNVATPPGEVRNLYLVRAYPLWVAGFVAVIGLLAVGHALLVTARRRAQQIGILRALGLTRAQIVGAVSTQGGATCIAGAVVGLPLGVALGRWVWTANAHQLGVGEDAATPVGVLLVVIGAGLGLLLVFGAIAGWWAGRSTPAHALRAP